MAGVKMATAAKATTKELTCTAFAGGRRVAAGPLPDVGRAVRAALDRDEGASILVFDDATGDQLDLDLRGTPAAVAARLRKAAADPSSAAGVAAVSAAQPAGIEPAAPRGPGRPKLGVVAREVTLLPRHWDWLNSQPGGASVALRKLVEDARKTHAGRDKVRRSQEAAYRFTSALAGNLEGFEAAARALFAADRPGFEAATAIWPADVAEHAKRLAEAALA